jgi:5,10-methylenetetrahydromethanopterin reductase
MRMKFALDAAPGTWTSALGRNDPTSVTQAVDRTIELARIADQAGIASIWVMEDPDGWDAFAVLAAMARVTERTKLGTGVTNPYYRHPSLIAASISTLDLLSNGRAFLGLGRGQSEWYDIALGMHVGRPTRALPEAIDLLHQWWSPQMRASSPSDATEFAVDDWERVIRPLQGHVPIHLAAVGPIALRIAGRHADGVVFNDLASFDFMRDAVSAVRNAANEAGRDPGTISFHARTAISVTNDVEAVYERRKATVAAIHALPGMERLLKSDRFDTARIIADVRAAMRTQDILDAGGGFGDMRRAGDLDAAKRAIPNDLMAELVVAGTVDQVRARLAELESIGIDEVFLAHQGPDVTVDSLAELLEQLGS